MFRRSLTAIAAISAACGSAAPPEAGPPAEPARPPGTGSALEESATPTKCEQLPFAESTPVPEASGAAWMTIDGALALVVVGDSGNDGAYAVIDPETGATREQGKLPLGTGNDDLEGLAIRDGRLVAVSSSGWIREWKRVAKGFELVLGPYPLGPIDLPDKGTVDRDEPGMVCSERKTNCGRDYEGICLAPIGQRTCLGFVAAKADGTLYCLLERDGKLIVDRSLAIPITGGKRIADCAFSETGVLVVGSNLFDQANVYRVVGWTEPAQARVEVIGALGLGFPEVIAMRGDILYRFSDTGGAPSLMTKYRCRPN
jgi:outer membrane protein assembly factor BamB